MPKSKSGRAKIIAQVKAASRAVDKALEHLYAADMISLGENKVIEASKGTAVAQGVSFKECLAVILKHL